MTTNATSATPLSEMTFDALLAAVQPAVRAVEQAELALVAIRTQHREAVQHADATRNTAIGAAKTRRDAAEAAYQHAVRQAADLHQATLDEAQALVSRATTGHREACERADPLLRELRVRHERMAKSASRTV